MTRKTNDSDLLRAYKSGQSPGEYAAGAGLSLYTVEHHLTKLSLMGLIEPEEIVPAEELDGITAVLPRTNWDGKLGSMHEILEERYSYLQLKMLMRNEAFLEKLSEVCTGSACERRVRYRLSEVRRVKPDLYLQIPGLYVYFVFGLEYENEILFIDTTTNLGKVIRDCRSTAAGIGYIEAESREEAEALACYYTAGMHPKYPTKDAEKNVITEIDEKKRKTVRIRFKKEEP